MAQTVEIVRVGLAGEGGFIIVQFRAPPQEAERWWQGAISVIDEESQAVYTEIPVMPKVGPLIGRPSRTGSSATSCWSIRRPVCSLGAGSPWCWAHIGLSMCPCNKTAGDRAQAGWRGRLGARERKMMTIRRVVIGGLCVAAACVL